MAPTYNEPMEEIMGLVRELGFTASKQLLQSAVDARKRLDIEREFHKKNMPLYEPAPGIYLPDTPDFREGF